MRLKSPFLRIVLNNHYLEIEFENVAIFAEFKRGRFTAEIYIDDVGYIYEKKRWQVYDVDEKTRQLTARDVEMMRSLAKKLSTLPNYIVLKKLIDALNISQIREVNSF